jgi:hypothetical protein
MAVTDAVIRAGAVAPEALRLTIGAGSSSLDLTTVTAVSVELIGRSGGTKSWTLAIDSATATTLVASKSFAAGDVPQTNIYTMTARLTVPGGIRRCEPTRLIVTA